MSPVEGSLKSYGIGVHKIPEIVRGTEKILQMRSFSFEWGLFCWKRGVQVTTKLHGMIYAAGRVRCSYRMQICLIYHIQLIFQIFYKSLCLNEGVMK